ncbi:hypothetical protein ASG49_02755 [Marmoricola sp. Leaf446]|uniref:hypothetical protein n=1 Tax=Marmoricola sp. Leaf446 TaxID=1736379 RepID=UPI0006F47DF9|nr:hypothetical protein [Marmoricola sp. Leaf446]KQT93891.1 hypothetical protein ASG49_02755 [Marmoricola sp. Leaf446]
MSPAPGRDADEPDPTTRSPYSVHGTPAPLAAAAGLTFVQALLVILFGVAELVSVDRERLVLGITTTLFFILFGGTLALCAWGLNAIRPWARGPVLLAQLVWLGLAWSFRGYWPVAVLLVVSAAVVLAGLLHPRSIDALESARGQ